MSPAHAPSEPVDPAAAAPAQAPVDQLVDWDLAARTAAFLAPAGPALSRDEAAEVVARLRAAAGAATAEVERVSLLHAPVAEPVLVVDRAGWSRANSQAFRTLLDPVLDEVVERRGRLPGGSLTAVGSRLTGAEVGSLLAFLSTRVLGQYDPFSPAPGRLMLVAPNIVHAERELQVPPEEFRLWVALHEETHRVQFGAAPWLADHLVGEIRSLVGDLLLDPSELIDRLGGALRSASEQWRSAEQSRPVDSGFPLVDLLRGPEQRARLAGVTAVMSLLEGHADVVMDEVGPAVIPSVALIRERFTRRRAGRGVLDLLVRRVLGLEAKLRQYAVGAAFVRDVVGRVGTDGLNAVWGGPQTLPTAAEIADPAAWVRRVHG